MSLILDTQRIEAHEKAQVFERTKQLSEEAVNRDWKNNADTFADDGTRPTTDIFAQMGRALTRLEVEKRLRQCNPNFLFEISKADPSKSGVYVVEPMPDDLGVMRNQKRFLVGMESGVSPEFSVRHVVPERIPHPEISGEFITRSKFVGETRGWRTVVARLIRLRRIRKESAESAFNLNQGMESKNFQQLTT